MSYSLHARCHNCIKRKNCIDHRIVLGAIQTIQSFSEREGHRGAGNITLNCDKFVEGTPADLPVTEPTPAEMLGGVNTTDNTE